MVQRDVGGGVGAPAVGGQPHGGDAGRVAEGAVGDQAGGAAALHARDQDVADRAGADLAPRVHDQHVSGADALDGDALGIGQVVEPAVEGVGVQVLAHGDVAQG